MTIRRRQANGRAWKGPDVRPAAPAAAVDPPTGPIRPARPVAPGDPPSGVAYPLILRGDGYVWWRSLLGVALALLLYVLVTSAVSSAVTGVGYAVQQPALTSTEYAAAGRRFELPIGMLAQNLAIAALTLVAWVVTWVVHQVRPRWLSSVRPGIRWRYLLLCVGAAAVILNGVALIPTLTGSGPAGQTQPQPQLLGFLIVILLTSPLQAAAEEYLFRGYLLQALGSLVANPWFGVVVSATLFALFHGGQNLPLFLNRLAFGLLAAALVLKTGGLEAGIAAHIINNVSAYTMAALTTSVASLRAVRELTWLASSLNIAGFALFTAAALLIAHRLRLRTTTPAAIGSVR